MYLNQIYFCRCRFSDPHGRDRAQRALHHQGLPSRLQRQTEEHFPLGQVWPSCPQEVEELGLLRLVKKELYGLKRPLQKTTLT